MVTLCEIQLVTEYWWY